MSGNLTFIRISIHLVILTCSILIAMDLLGVLQSKSSDLAASRIQLCESLALESATAASRKDYSSIRKMFDAVVRRSDDVRSIGLRGRSGQLYVATVDHGQLWSPEASEGSTMTHARMPLIAKGEQWGTIEVRFESGGTQGLAARLWGQSLVRVLLFVAISGFLAYTFYMRRILRHLDPTAVIPPRVQATLDVMAEGVVLLDRNERIVLANSTFVALVGHSVETLIGMKASELGWLVPKSLEPALSLPWQRALNDAETHTGTPLSLKIGEDRFETFVVNGAPIAEDSGQARGAIATFNSITALEQKADQLEQALVMLEKLNDEANLRNEELEVLATCDSLTGLSNRRAFMAKAELEFETSARDERELCCVMVDIDHFKLVNDEHGHSMGDEVICLMAQALISAWPEREMVCRFGGEEFCMLLANVDIEEVMGLVERLRRTVSAQGFAAVPVTASFGVSARSFGATRFYDLLDQSDQSLYASNESGRNRVTRFDAIQEES